MMDLNVVLDEVKQKLHPELGRFAVEIRKSDTAVPAEGDGQLGLALVGVVEELRGRHRVKCCRLENGFSSVGEGFSCLMSGASAGYAYVALEVQLGHEITGELTPFSQQGMRSVRMLESVAEQQGGFLQVETRGEESLRFTARLPIGNDHSLGELVEKPVTGKTILLVEDEEFVRNVTQEVLEMEGYRVLAVENGADAMKTIKAEQSVIDLLLTDVVLPGMSGRELAARLEGIIPELRVVFMSGYTDNPVLRNKVAQATTAYLQKPFTLDTLIDKIDEVLNLEVSANPIFQRVTATGERMEARG